MHVRFSLPLLLVILLYSLHPPANVFGENVYFCIDFDWRVSPTPEIGIVGVYGAFWFNVSAEVYSPLFALSGQNVPLEAELNLINAGYNVSVEFISGVYSERGIHRIYHRIEYSSLTDFDFSDFIYLGDYRKISFDDFNVDSSVYLMINGSVNLIAYSDKVKFSEISFSSWGEHDIMLETSLLSLLNAIHWKIAFTFNGSLSFFDGREGVYNEILSGNVSCAGDNEVCGYVLVIGLPLVLLFVLIAVIALILKFSRFVKP